ncbi:hypothetical protein [Polyangium jinanense]|uniref:Uncharacterized protein n=1 Tax=Polyangium jinanense TaxID=2829994 RepID=A0A9X3XHF5_9BACT|nr:hypothetical protein [Polyangium jinanense]MDC3959647.1 hypothetical protein [Polyangium jinanense]MDC3989425.1 hypothetical protein [Polyangium jinanense]
MSDSVRRRTGDADAKQLKKRRPRAPATALRVHDAALALAPDGTVFIALSQLVGSDELATVLERARSETGAVFVGVPLEERELSQFVIPRLQKASVEAAAWVLGVRRAGSRSARRRIRA